MNVTENELRLAKKRPLTQIEDHSTRAMEPSKKRPRVESLSVRAVREEKTKKKRKKEKKKFDMSKYKLRTTFLKPGDSYRDCVLVMAAFVLKRLPSNG